MTITFLGTATSHGLPFVGCDCGVCTSTDPHNKRLRCSILVEDAATDTHILVDTSPDLRQQLLRQKVSKINAVLWTHFHNDHVIGLDDLRRVTDMNGYLDGYANQKTLDHLYQVFEYAFVPGREHGGFPRLLAHLARAFESFEIGPFKITPIPILHGTLEVFAWRFEHGKSTFIYATDCSQIPEDSWDALSDADALVLDALRPEPHPTHFSLEQAMDAARELHPKHALFTHFSHEMDHSTISAQLPDGMEMAYDGLTLEL